MLHFFDAHVHADAIDASRLENLAYFDVRTVLAAAHAPRPFASGEDLLNYYNDLVTNELHRLQRGGIRPVFALGVHPAAVPRRVHHEVWRELPALLMDPLVVAVGELALESGTKPEEDLLARQLELAEQLDLPALVSPGVRERARRVRRILEIVGAVGIRPHRVIVNHVDFTSLRGVLDAGCWAGITVGAPHLAAAGAAELVSRYRETALERCVFNTALSQGPADVLALPKTAMALLESGFVVSQVRRLVWGNATRLLLEGRG